ncbi:MULTISPECIES: hypothetical protein [unclassified Serratia (in: enterobacteria)]|uniref:hypothetical protein n=1 Tax=unclassified Serratia (in: enterobacteria) TaxID=2647522 RepID=UPI00046A9D46|nr:MULTISPECIES: hypothetical protein [unclassified Serratia (in: enterobacteria)]
MTPEDVRMVISEILPQLKTMQVTTYLIAGGIGLLGATIGAFGGAYLKKRGENRANDAHFSALSQQLRETTKDTEWIKTSLSGSHWVSQQNWVSKEKYYTTLVTHLANWSTAIVTQMNYFEGTNPHDAFEMQNDDYVTVQRDKAKAASEAISELKGPILVFLTEETNTSLDRLSKSLSEAGEGYIANDDLLEMINTALTTTLKSILNEAKVDLNKPLLTIDSTTIIVR